MTDKHLKVWQNKLKKVGDNPNYIFDQLDAMKTELKSRDRPDPGYLREKSKKISTWIDEIEKFNK